jgi:hypothetical protein
MQDRQPQNIVQEDHS